MTAPDAAPLPPLNLHEYETAARAAPVTDGLALRRRWQRRRGDVAGQPGRLRPLALAAAGATRLREVSTATSVLGQDIALPVLIAPSAPHRLCHDEGERATARAAKAAGTIYTMSTAATLTIEEVAPEAGPWWFQLFLYRDRERTRDLVRGPPPPEPRRWSLTVDAPMRGRREAKSVHFTMPADIAAALWRRRIEHV